MIRPATSARQSIAKIAASMTVGEIGLLEGCRIIVSLKGNLSELDMHDGDFLTLVGVESEMEDIPLGAVRELWAPDALLAKDASLAEYLYSAREEILRACDALGTKWAAPG